MYVYDTHALPSIPKWPWFYKLWPAHVLVILLILTNFIEPIVLNFEVIRVGDVVNTPRTPKSHRPTGSN